MLPAVNPTFAPSDVMNLRAAVSRTLARPPAPRNEIGWPELPAARPEVNFPVDLAWENIQRNPPRVGPA